MFYRKPVKFIVESSQGEAPVTVKFVANLC